MGKKIKVIMATHGYLADGFAGVIKMIVGEMENLMTLCCYTNPDFDLDETIQNVMEHHDFENADLVVCTDIMGGSVNNGFVKWMEKYPFHLVTNTNLAFLIDLLLTGENLDSDALKEKIQDPQAAVSYVNDHIPAGDDLDIL